MKYFHNIDTSAENSERDKINPEKLVAGNPTTMAVNQFANAEGNLFVGVWGSDAGKWKICYTEDEMCTILEGEAILTDKDGLSKQVKAGDSFVIASGFEGTWETINSVKKLYVIYDK